MNSVGIRILPRRWLRFFCLDEFLILIRSGLSPFTELAAERKSVSSSNSVFVSEVDDCKRKP